LGQVFHHPRWITVFVHAGSEMRPVFVVIATVVAGMCNRRRNAGRREKYDRQCGNC
jgi:hypothetical protein